MDLTAGLDPRADHAALVGDPTDRFFGENHALWLWDEQTSTGCHLYLKTLGHVASFRLRRETIYIFLPGDRVLQVDQDGPGPDDPLVPRGPNLRFECIEPFRRWRAAFDCTARFTSAAELRTDLLRETPPVALSFQLELTMAAPPWTLGTFTSGDQVERARPFFGGLRYEQLLRGTGTVVADGTAYPVDGVGMRTHRVGTRNTGAFPGHSWMTGLWPDGRSFGVHRYCGLDGVATFEEAWVGHGEKRHAAGVRDLTLFSADLPGEALRVELESDQGVGVIDGTLRATNFVTTRQPDPQKFLPGFDHTIDDGRIMTQGLANFRWDGHDGQGMVERSALVAEINGRSIGAVVR